MVFSFTTASLKSIDLGNPSESSELSVLGSDRISGIGFDLFTNNLYYTSYDDEIIYKIDKDGSNLEEYFNPMDFGISSFNVGTLAGFSFLDIPSSTNNASLNLDINLFPNPSTGNLNINLGESGNFSLECYNMLGQLIHQMDNLDIQNSLSLDLEKGTYLIKITNKDNKRSTTRKINVVN